MYIYIFFSTQIKSLVQASLPRTIYPRTSDHFIGEDNRGKKTLARISADTICTHATIFSNLLDEQPRFVACDLTSSPLHAHQEVINKQSRVQTQGQSVLMKNDRDNLMEIRDLDWVSFLNSLIIKITFFFHFSYQLKTIIETIIKKISI